MKVSEYTAITVLAGTDLFYVSQDNGGGTFVSRHITWAEVLDELAATIDTSYLGDFNLNAPAANDFLRSDGTDWINAVPPSIIYTADDQSASYSGQDNSDTNPTYATVDDLNALRGAYENLRTAFDALLSWVLTGV